MKSSDTPTGYGKIFSPDYSAGKVRINTSVWSTMSTMLRPVEVTIVGENQDLRDSKARKIMMLIENEKRFLSIMKVIKNKIRIQFPSLWFLSLFLPEYYHSIIAKCR